MALLISYVWGPWVGIPNRPIRVQDDFHFVNRVRAVLRRRDSDVSTVTDTVRHHATVNSPGPAIGIRHSIWILLEHIVDRASSIICANRPRGLRRVV
jgi:hypothetical protein